MPELHCTPEDSALIDGFKNEQTIESLLQTIRDMDLGNLSLHVRIALYGVLQNLVLEDADKNQRQIPIKDSAYSEIDTTYYEEAVKILLKLQKDEKFFHASVQLYSDEMDELDTALIDGRDFRLNCLKALFAEWENLALSDRQKAIVSFFEQELIRLRKKYGQKELMMPEIAFTSDPGAPLGLLSPLCNDSGPTHSMTLSDALFSAGAEFAIETAVHESIHLLLYAFSRADIERLPQHFQILARTKQAKWHFRASADPWISDIYLYEPEEQFAREYGEDYVVRITNALCPQYSPATPDQTLA